MALLRGVVESEGVTALVATHDPVMIALADRVMRIRDGSVSEAAGAGVRGLLGIPCRAHVRGRCARGGARPRDVRASRRSAWRRCCSARPASAPSTSRWPAPRLIRRRHGVRRRPAGRAAAGPSRRARGRRSRDLLAPLPAATTEGRRRRPRCGSWPARRRSPTSARSKGSTRRSRLFTGRSPAPGRRRAEAALPKAAAPRSSSQPDEVVRPGPRGDGRRAGSATVRVRVVGRLPRSRARAGTAAARRGGHGGRVLRLARLSSVTASVPSSSTRRTWCPGLHPRAPRPSPAHPDLSRPSRPALEAGGVRVRSGRRPPHDGDARPGRAVAEGPPCPRPWPRWRGRRA